MEPLSQREIEIIQLQLYGEIKKKRRRYEDDIERFLAGDGQPDYGTGSDEWESSEL